MIELSNQVLDLEKAIDAVQDDQGGAINVFVGTVRNKTKSKKVLRLEFEAYEPMAVKEMQKILDQANQKWPILRAVLMHRVGVLAIGEVPVIIAVATPHRKASFEACAYIIDTLKETVPIWKKEIFEDGDVWVAAHP